MRLIDRLFFWSLVSFYLVTKPFKDIIGDFPDAAILLIVLVFLAVPLMIIIGYPILAICDANVATGEGGENDRLD